MQAFNFWFALFALLIVVMVAIAAYLAKEIEQSVLLGVLSFCAFFLVVLLYPIFDR